MSPKISKSLSLHRLEQAREDLEAAKLLYKKEYYKSANNRAYYAIFHAMNALFALAEKGYKKHSGVITNFGLDYIQTGKIESEFGRIANYAFRIRTKTDSENRNIS